MWNENFSFSICNQKYNLDGHISKIFESDCFFDLNNLSAS